MKQNTVLQIEYVILVLCKFCEIVIVLVRSIIISLTVQYTIIFVLQVKISINFDCVHYYSTFNTA